VEVLQLMGVEQLTEVPVAQVEIVEKAIPKVTTQVVEIMQEVPQVLVEECLVEVPQMQMAEAIKQVSKSVVQARQRGIPKVTTQVVEMVQTVPVALINEVAVDVPQTQVIEVMKQTAVMSQQILSQTSRQYELQTEAYRTMPAVEAGVYMAQTIGTRDNVSSVVTNVPRQSPAFITGATGAYETIGSTVYNQYGGAQTLVEYEPAVMQYAQSAPVMFDGAVELMPQTMYQEMIAPTTYMEMVAPTTMLAAPTMYQEMVAPTTYMEMIAPTTLVANTMMGAPMVTNTMMVAPTYA